jgi:anti-sigma B factor antagonist
MSVRKRAILSVVVLEVIGSFFGDAETDELAQAIAQVGAEGNRHLVLDLEECKVMNSTALSVLAQAHRDYAARGGVIRLCGLQKRMQNILSLTRLLDLFGHHPSLDEALASFAEAESAA